MSAPTKIPPHPIQPLLLVGGVIRFKENKLVSDLLDLASKHGLSLNDIAGRNYSNEDRQQLAQLIGYSLSGYGELQSYVDDEAYNVAEATYQKKKPETQVRIEYLRGELSALRRALRKPMARLFQIHPDDLK